MDTIDRVGSLPPAGELAVLAERLAAVRGDVLASPARTYVRAAAAYTAHMTSAVTWASVVGDDCAAGVALGDVLAGVEVAGDQSWSHADWLALFTARISICAARCVAHTDCEPDIAPRLLQAAGRLLDDLESTLAEAVGR